MPSVDLSTTGREYWRSLDELAETEEFQHFLAHEFPNFEGNQDVLQSSSRRNFLKIMGASFALVGLTGCRRWPEQKLAPYASRPEGMMPGVPEKYASAWEFAGIAQPLLVTTVDGRPLKIDGHPDHPASLGKSSHWAQASILEMYDPDRSRTVMRRENGNRNPVTWERFDRETAGEFAALREADGRGFAILSEASSSPSLARLRRRFQQIYPNATWYEYEPVSRDAQISGAEIAFGQRLRTVLHLDQAAVIVSLDADLLGTDPDVLRNSRGWGRGRAAVDEGWMNRLYIAEPNFTVTGTVADGRLPAPPSRIAALAIAIHAGITGGSVSENVSLSPAEQAFVDDVVSDLQEVGSRGLLVAGPSQSAEVHALCHAVNARLNAIGTTVHFVEEPADSGSIAGIRELNDRIREGSIEALFMIGGNPVWDAPTDLSFGEAVAQVPVSMHLSIYDDETSQASTWHLPRAHYLEAWGDCRTMDGTISIAQPMIRPLYDGRSAIEMLARINNERPFDGADIVRTTLRPMLRNEAEFEKAWRVAVRNAGVPDSAWSRVTPRLRSNLPMPEVKARAATAEYEAVFVLDHSMYDGRFANNGWLQELPDPLTKITWDNAVLVSPSLARDRGIENEELIDITINGRTLQMAAFVVPGIAPGTLVIPLGYGRTAAGNVGTEVGFNTYQMRTTDALGFVVNAKISPTGRSYMLASTQNHHLIEEGLLENMYEDRKKDLVREADLETYLKKPDFPKKKKSLDLRLQLWDDPVNYDEGHQWGMAIDMNRCTGCNACIVACQSENNIPIVGKEQVHRGREMHWLRIDRYFKGDEDAPIVSHQPMTCHHCENAPCESVCPVAATVHDHEGLNVMVYNRCIGTRYCSNNCPFKVRRFNYYDWHARDPRISHNDTMPHLGWPDTQTRDEVDGVRQMKFNPEVSVRMRGVMEKCTFCTQRIQAAKIDAKNEFVKGNRETARVQEGEVVSACADACPTEAIVFGDLNDPNSKVRRWTEKARTYSLLDHLNLRPRLTYQARVRNTPGAGRLPGGDVFDQPTGDYADRSVPANGRSNGTSRNGVTRSASAAAETASSSTTRSG